MRTFPRILLVLILLFFVLPLVIPLPVVGVEAETLADPDGYFVDINGLQTYVLERGPVDGEPVILLHGWGASTFSWRENIDVLAEAGYRVIAYDRPPYGLSQKIGDIPYSLSGQADYLAALMDQLDIERAHLVGNSAGGFLTGYFAVEYPDRVRKLVFVDGVPRPIDETVEAGQGASSRVGGALGLPPVVLALLDFPPTAWWIQLGVRALVQPSFVSDILVSAYHDPDFVTPEIEAGYERALRVHGWDVALLDQLRGGAIQADPLTTAALQDIEAPIMIVWGEEDTWIPMSAADVLRELQPDARWITYPDTGHLPMEEASSDFNADLLDFLEAEDI